MSAGLQAGALDRPRRIGPGAAEAAIVVVAFTILALGFTYPLLTHFASHIPESLGDPRVNAWTLAWGADRLTAGLKGFWSPPFFYPYPNALGNGEHLLGISVLVAPVRWAGGSPVVVYNTAFVAAFVLAGCGMYLLARDITVSRPAAALAAVAFAFCPYRTAQLAHLQVLMVGWLVIGLWAMNRWFARGSWIMLALAGAALILQALANSYSLFYAPVAVLVVAGWHALQGRWTTRITVAIVASLVVGGAVLAPFGRLYLDATRGVQVPVNEILANGADLGTYLSTDPRIAMGDWLPGVHQPEGNLFPGAIVLGLAVVALWPSKTRAGRDEADGAPGVRATEALRIPAPVWAVMIVLAVWLSQGPSPRAWGASLGTGAPYRWLMDLVPGFALMRVPARFGMVAMLGVAALAGIGAARLLSGSAQNRALIACVLGGLVMLEGYGGRLLVLPVGLAYEPHERAAYEWLASRPGGPLLELPIAISGLGDRSLLAQYAALDHGHPVVQGIGRWGDTPLKAFLAGSASPFNEPAGLADAVPLLRGLGIRYVLVHRSGCAEARCAGYVQALRFAGPELVTEKWFDTTGAFELQPAEPRDAGPAGTLSQIPSQAMRTSASQEGARLPSLFDGQPGTRWLTGRPQRGAEWVRIDFDRPRSLRLLQIVVTPRSFSDYPRVLVIESTNASGRTTELHRGSVLEPFGRGLVASPGQPIVTLEIRDDAVTSLVLRQTGASPVWYWSIDELRLWEAVGARP